jgi:hypothetical protein
VFLLHQNKETNKENTLSKTTKMDKTNKNKREKRENKRKTVLFLLFLLKICLFTRLCVMSFHSLLLFEYSCEQTTNKKQATTK